MKITTFPSVKPLKKIFSSLFFAFLFYGAYSQVPSNCIVPSLLADSYEKDIKNLALKRMHLAESPDTILVEIPQYWQDTIAEGLAAIVNAFSIPESDSVFNLYCVHDNTFDHSVYQSFMVKVDTAYSWTSAWQNLVTLTGNTFIDSIITKYGFQVTQFYNWTIGNYAIIETPSLLNSYALMDSINIEPGVLDVEVNALIGGGGKIEYYRTGSDRYYDFYLEYNDCLDGCDNYRKWKFKVLQNCSVEYLGFDDWGFFGTAPLPAPLNCNIFTSAIEYKLQQPAYTLYPNPANDKLNIRLNKATNCTVVIMDMQGKAVKQLKTSELQTEVSVIDLTNGIYFIHLTNDTSSIIRKISIAK